MIKLLLLAILAVMFWPLVGCQNPSHVPNAKIPVPGCPSGTGIFASYGEPSRGPQGGSTLLTWTFMSDVDLWGSETRCSVLTYAPRVLAGRG